MILVLLANDPDCSLKILKTGPQLVFTILLELAMCSPNCEHTEPQNVTLFVSRIFEDVNS